jgi:hypothetical protein
MRPFMAMKGGFKCYLDHSPNYFGSTFLTPMTQARQAEICELRGIPQSQLKQTHLPVQLWATQAEYLHGQEAQLML